MTAVGNDVFVAFGATFLYEARSNTLKPRLCLEEKENHKTSLRSWNLFRLESPINNQPYPPGIRNQAGHLPRLGRSTPFPCFANRKQANQAALEENN